jgi:hypothetical protein
MVIDIPVLINGGSTGTDFDAGNIHYKGHRKGWALKIKTFLGPEMETSEARASWAQKSRDFYSLPPPPPPPPLAVAEYLYVNCKVTCSVSHLFFKDHNSLYHLLKKKKQLLLIYRYPV